MVLRISRFIPLTKVEGPGLRSCIWVQGCPIHCENCAVPEMWSFNNGKSIDIKFLANKILKQKKIEGVTFSGGEPFSQARELYELGKILKNESDLTILTYTGYSFDFIKDSNLSEWNKLISITDILIDGPYVADMPSNNLWIGSSNQKYHFLSNRYQDLENQLQKKTNQVEFHINPDGKVTVNGILDFDDLDGLFKGMVKKK